ncbi:hypothetical protein D3C86_1991070 [compost metagenome]
MLRLRNQINDFVRYLLQLSVRHLLEQITDSFKPLRHVAILEHHAVEIALLQSGSDSEILDGVTWLVAFNSVIQRLPLVWDYYIAN